MLIEDIATRERCTVATDQDFSPGQHVVLDGRRWVVVAVENEPGSEPRKATAGDVPPPERHDPTPARTFVVTALVF